MKQTAIAAVALTVSLLAAGCPEADDTSAADTDTSAEAADTSAEAADTSAEAADTSAADTEATLDSAAATLDSAATDTVEAEDPAAGDTVMGDSAAGPGDAGDASGCQPLDELMVIECDEIWRHVRYWSDWTDAACPTWYTHGTDSYPTLEALTADLSCDPACLLRATNAVTVLTCDGNRTGYEVYEGGDGCGGPIYGTPIGLLEDLCDWPARSCNCDQE